MEINTLHYNSECSVFADDRFWLKYIIGHKATMTTAESNGIVNMLDRGQMNLLCPV